MNIAIFEIEPREAGAFQVLAGSGSLVEVAEALGPDNAKSFADAQIISTFIYSELDRKVLEQLPALRMIATRSTGFDHIDTAYCAERGITVCNVPHYGENTVAEHVFALLLALSHRLPEAIERAKTGPFSPQGLQGFDLAGKTLGVVGAGNIGRHVIRIAKGFEMEVLASDPNGATELARQFDFRFVELDELLSASDVVTLHVPATETTRHMLGREQFARMKRGAVLINTARGNLVEPQALVEALHSGKLAFAGLDVLTGEPLIREEAELISSSLGERPDLRNLVADYVLLRMPNVIITPHNGFNTREAIDRIVHTSVANIEAFLKGEMQNAVV